MCCMVLKNASFPRKKNILTTVYKYQELNNSTKQMWDFSAILLDRDGLNGE